MIAVLSNKTLTVVLYPVKFTMGMGSIFDALLQPGASTFLFSVVQHSPLDTSGRRYALFLGFKLFGIGD